MLFENIAMSFLTPSELKRLKAKNIKCTDYLLASNKSIVLKKGMTLPTYKII